MEQTIIKRNPVSSLSIGTNRMDSEKLYDIITAALSAEITLIDTARDYGNEDKVGTTLNSICKEAGMQRNSYQITTKVGNSQQLSGNMRNELNISLKNLKTNYVDIWLLHWPLPGYYVNNLIQMRDLCDEGIVKSFGLANPRLRHLEELERNNIIPHVIQIEHHPFRQSPEIIQYCQEKNIQVEAYSPLCFMIDKIRNNDTLLHIAQKHNKNIGQVILRWHYQHKVIPVFRTGKPSRLAENANIFDFELDEEDLQAIKALDEDYKFIPESLHCTGY